MANPTKFTAAASSGAGSGGSSEEQGAGSGERGKGRTNVECRRTSDERRGTGFPRYFNQEILISFSSALNSGSPVTSSAFFSFALVSKAAVSNGSKNVGVSLS